MQQPGNYASNILPLPRAIGRDLATVTHQPMRLFIKERTPEKNPQILDMWGREVIYVRNVGRLTNRYQYQSVTTGQELFQLRRKYFGDYWRFEKPGGQVIGTIETKRNSCFTRWQNTACQGEEVRLDQRGDWFDRFPALMWGPTPVVLIDRTDAEGIKGYKYNSRDYQALVAPGADLVWIAALISAFELVKLDWGEGRIG